MTKRDLSSATSAGRRMSPAERESRRQMARQLYESGLNAAEVGDVLGVSRERSRQILQESGVQMRPASGDPQFAEERRRRIEQGLQSVSTNVVDQGLDQEES